jgi:hypothetical protein
VPLKHQQIRLELMYGASWPLYFDFPPDLLISTITLQLFMILTAPLDSGTNSDLEPGRGMDSETASDGCSGLYISLLDAPQVAPLIIPQWRRPDQRDRGTVLHDVTLPPCRFQPKYILESPKSPITQTLITQSFQSRFPILSMQNMALCLIYSTQFDSHLRRLPERSYKIVCTPESPPLTHLVSAIPNFGHNYFASMTLFKNLHQSYRMRGDISSVNGANNNQIICQI